MHTARNTRSAAQQSVARDARVHYTHVSAPQPCVPALFVLRAPPSEGLSHPSFACVCPYSRIEFLFGNSDRYHDFSQKVSRVV